MHVRSLNRVESRFPGPPFVRDLAMKAATLKKSLEEDPHLGNYTPVILRHKNNGFEEYDILRVEYDSRDNDLNLVISKPNGNTPPIASFQALVDEFNDRVDDRILICTREYYDPPRYVEGKPWTHKDTSIYSYATQDETRRLGLFEWFEGIEKLFSTT